jgi:hypothetical protein
MPAYINWHRSRGSRAREQRDELTSFQPIELHPLPLAKVGKLQVRGSPQRNISALMSAASGQSRPVRAAYFSSECPLFPGSDR